MDLKDKIIKGFIVVNKDGEWLKKHLRNIPSAYILNEFGKDHLFDEKECNYTSFLFYTKKDDAKDFADWWTGNCGEIAQVREIEVKFGNISYEVK